MEKNEKDSSICQHEIKPYAETHRNTPLTQFSPSGLQIACFVYSAQEKYIYDYL